MRVPPPPSGAENILVGRVTLWAEREEGETASQFMDRVADEIADTRRFHSRGSERWNAYRRRSREVMAGVHLDGKIEIMGELLTLVSNAVIDDASTQAEHDHNEILQWVRREGERLLEVAKKEAMSA